jgi:predicted nucleic-acid-binding protein
MIQARLCQPNRFITKGAWVSVLVLAEAVWVLARVYKLGSKELASGIEMLLNHNHLSLQDADAVAEALALYRSRPSLGFSDCLILELARKSGCLPLGTFDRGLSKQEGTQKL